MLQLLRNRQQHGLNPQTRGITHYEIQPLTGSEPQTIDMADAALTLTRSVGNPAGTLLLGNLLYVDPQSSGTSENLLLPPEANCEGLVIHIFNTSGVAGEEIAVQNDAGGALVTVAPDRGSVFFCDGTTWFGSTFIMGNVGASDIAEFGVTEPKMARDMLKYTDTQLSAAQVNALAAANITVVAAPAANLAVIPVDVHMFLDSGGTDFVQVNNSDQLALVYAGGAEAAELGTEAQCTAFLEATGDAALHASVLGPGAPGGIVPTAAAAINLDNNGAAEYTTGDGTLSIRVYYREVPMIAFT